MPTPELPLLSQTPAGNGFAFEQEATNFIASFGSETQNNDDRDEKDRDWKPNRLCPNSRFFVKGCPSPSVTLIHRTAVPGLFNTFIR